MAGLPGFGLTASASLDVGAVCVYEGARWSSRHVFGRPSHFPSVRAVMPLPSAFQRYSRLGSCRSGHAVCRRAGCTRRRCEMDLGQQFHEVDGP